jgi:hypothetical protein
MNKLRLVAKIRFYTGTVDFSNVSLKLARISRFTAREPTTAAAGIIPQ